MSLYFHLPSRLFHLDIVNFSVRLDKIKKAFHELHWLHCFNHYWPQLALMASQPTNLTLFVGIGLTQKTTLVNPFPTKLESTQFLQIWPFFVGIGLTLKWPKKVNPIPTKSTQFLQLKSTQFLQSQPNSYNGFGVNPIPTNADFNPIPTTKSTQLQLISDKTCFFVALLVSLPHAISNMTHGHLRPLQT